MRKLTIQRLEELLDYFNDVDCDGYPQIPSEEFGHYSDVVDALGELIARRRVEAAREEVARKYAEEVQG